MRGVRFEFDTYRLRPLPWRLVPDPKGRKGAVWDAENRWMCEIVAESREQLLELGRLLEAVTWAACEPEPREAAAPAHDMQHEAPRGRRWGWAR